MEMVTQQADGRKKIEQRRWNTRSAMDGASLGKDRRPQELIRARAYDQDTQSPTARLGSRLLHNRESAVGTIHECVRNQFVAGGHKGEIWRSACRRMGDDLAVR